MISPSTLTSDGSLPSSASPLSTPARSRSPLSTAEENGPAPGSATGTAAQMAQAVSVKSDVTAAIWADFAQPTDANGSYLAAVASSDSGGAKRGDKPAPPEVAAAAATSPRKAARPRPLNVCPHLKSMTREQRTPPPPLRPFHFFLDSFGIEMSVPPIFMCAPTARAPHTRPSDPPLRYPSIHTPRPIYHIP